MSADRFDEEARRLARQMLATVDYDQARAIFDEGWQEDPEEAEHTASLMTSQLAAALRAAHAEGAAEVDRLRAELEAARREADDAREERDHWHAKVAHIGQALGMAAPDSSDWRDVSADAVVRRAEAARAVSELVMLDLRDLVAEADRPRGGMGPQWQHELAGAARMPSVVRWARRAIARYDARASGEGT